MTSEQTTKQIDTRMAAAGFSIIMLLFGTIIITVCVVLQFGLPVAGMVLGTIMLIIGLLIGFRV